MFTDFFVVSGEVAFTFFGDVLSGNAASEKRPGTDGREGLLDSLKNHL